MPVALLGCAGAQQEAGNDGSGNRGGTGNNGEGGTGGDYQEPTDPVFLPARIRRMTNAEFDHTVAALLGASETPGKGFAPDTRQSDYTRNAGQRVDPVFAGQVQGAAKDLAGKTLDKLLSSHACAGQGNAGDACAQEIIGKFVPRAFRRPITDLEKRDLLDVYKAGAEGASFRDGISLVVEAVLQSASFLYHSELGAAARNGETTLTPHEVAAALAYVVTGGPPDADLIAAADADKLGSGDERAKHAKRLLESNGARAQLQQLVKEWLKLDKLEYTGKDMTVYQKFQELRPQMISELDDFIAEVVFKDDASVSKLLGADYTVVQPQLASFYGLSAASAGQRTMLGNVPRRGIMHTAGFLSVHGHDRESAPVLRGTLVLKKLLCMHLEVPANLNVVPPPPDPKQTTRERFAVHGKQPGCASCHDIIDPIGFAFENFDGMGGQRSMDNGKPVDTNVEMTKLDVLNGKYTDSTGIVAKLAASSDVRGCFARNLFRFASAQSGEGTDKKFTELYDSLAAGVQGNLKDLLVAYVGSELFIKRRIP